MGVVVVTSIRDISIRISINDKEEKEVGHVYLYIMTNDDHAEPFGFIENLFVENRSRGLGYAKRLMKLLEEEAVKRKCYKIIGCFRKEREWLAKFYEPMGYNCEYGIEFRKKM